MKSWCHCSSMKTNDEAFHSHCDRRHNTLGTGTLTRDFSVRLLRATDLFAHTGNQQKEIIMKAIKDPTKVLICFGTTANGQKDTHQPVLPSLEKLQLEYIYCRSGCQQTEICVQRWRRRRKFPSQALRRPVNNVARKCTKFNSKASC